MTQNPSWDRTFTQVRFPVTPSQRCYQIIILVLSQWNHTFTTYYPKCVNDIYSPMKYCLWVNANRNIVRKKNVNVYVINSSIILRGSYKRAKRATKTPSNYLTFPSIIWNYSIILPNSQSQVFGTQLPYFLPDHVHSHDFSGGFCFIIFNNSFYHLYQTRAW